MTTSIERDFAGELRRFDLLAPSPPGPRDRLVAVAFARFGDDSGRQMVPPPLVERLGTNLSVLAARARANELAAGDVTLVLVAGLACGDPARVEEANALVAEQARREGFGTLIPLAVDVLMAAFSGAESASETADADTIAA